MILNRTDHEFGHIRARDFESEGWQMPLSHAVLSRIWLVRQFRWAHHGPLERAAFKDSLHSGRIGHNDWKQQFADRYAGGMMESLNKKATDSTTTRLTLTCSMAFVSAVANCCKRYASDFEMGWRGPNAEMTAS
jgi:hypothetical protein